MKKKLFIVFGMVLCMGLFGCDKKTEVSKTNTDRDTNAEGSEDTEENEKTSDTKTNDKTDTEDLAKQIEAKDVTIADGITVKFSKFEVNSQYDSSATVIRLKDNDIAVEGEGARANGNVVTVSKEGTYVISGKLTDGQILVEAAKTDKIQLVLNGVDVTCTNGAPLCVKSADKTVLTLADGSVNVFTDGANGNEEQNACVFSKDDLAVNGTGTLTVNGNYNNGIGSKNDLEIISGTVNVTAVKNGLKGNDSVAVLTGDIHITAGKDGIKSDNDTETGKGYVYIENASITGKVGDDGIQAVNAIVFSKGTYQVECEGKKTNCDGINEIAEDVITE
ncbi:MAG: carbohydrate-binding domain-containing protein [Lachnospiraceae bacterium]|nr:carbohydrate-binding domain-containing protein [Lachnospiraceae bacterium]